MNTRSDSIVAFTSSTAPTEVPAHRPLPTRSAEEIEQLVLSVDPIVRQYARSVSRYGFAEFDDVLQDGRIGAIQAAHSWEPDIASFATHAMHRIRGEIADGLRRRDVVSRSIRQNWSPDDVRLKPQASLNVMIADSAVELGQLLPDPDALDPEELVVEAAYLDWQSAEVQYSMRFLDAFQRDVIRDYFWHGLTLLQIGERMGFTEGRASQIRSAALTTMWRVMAARDELIDQ